MCVLLRWLHAPFSWLHLPSVPELQPISDHRPAVSVLRRQCRGMERHPGGDRGAVPHFQEVPHSVVVYNVYVRCVGKGTQILYFGKSTNTMVLKYSITSETPNKKM